MFFLLIFKLDYFSVALYSILICEVPSFNHFSTTGRCSGPGHYDVSIRQAARAAFVTSSFKIFLTHTFTRCGATCYILPSRAMTQLFKGVNFVYRSVEVYLTFCSYLWVLVRIAFAMSVIEKVGEFLNTLTMQYELRYKWWINAVVMILSVPHCLCWLFYSQNIITFLFDKLSCAVEILIWSDAVDFLTKLLGMPYSVVTAQRACSTYWNG